MLVIIICFRFTLRLLIVPLLFAVSEIWTARQWSAGETIREGGKVAVSTHAKHPSFIQSLTLHRPENYQVICLSAALQVSRADAGLGYPRVSRYGMTLSRSRTAFPAHEELEYRGSIVEGHML